MCEVHLKWRLNCQLLHLFTTCLLNKVILSTTPYSCEFSFILFWNCLPKKKNKRGPVSRGVCLCVYSITTVQNWISPHRIKQRRNGDNINDGDGGDDDDGDNNINNNNSQPAHTKYTVNVLTIYKHFFSHKLNMHCVCECIVVHGVLIKWNVVIYNTTQRMRYI